MSSIYFLIVFMCFSWILPVQAKQKKTTANPTIEMLDALDNLNKEPAPKKNKSQKARSLIRKNKNTQAISFLESLDNVSSQSLALLAQAYENTNDYSNQIRVLRQLVKKNRKYAPYWITLAKGLRGIYFKTGKFEYRKQAMEAINEVFKLSKKYHERAHLEMLALLKYKEDVDGNAYAILQLLQTLIREFGIKKEYVKDICKYFYLNKFYSQSLNGCKKAIKYDPKEPRNYAYYALSMEEPDQIKKHLKKMIKKFPKSAFALTEAGTYFVKEKDYRAALPLFRKAYKIEPKSSRVRAGLAQSLFYTGKEKESYSHFLQACMLDKEQLLWAFKQAKSILNQKSKFKLATRFERGITKCFLKASVKKPKAKKAKVKKASAKKPSVKKPKAKKPKK